LILPPLETFSSLFFGVISPELAQPWILPYPLGFSGFPVSFFIIPILATPPSRCRAKNLSLVPPEWLFPLNFPPIPPTPKTGQKIQNYPFSPPTFVPRIVCQSGPNVSFPPRGSRKEILFCGWDPPLSSSVVKSGFS